MNSLKSPCKGMITDFRGRKACYRQDWTSALGTGARYGFLAYFDKNVTKSITTVFSEIHFDEILSLN